MLNPTLHNILVSLLDRLVRKRELRLDIDSVAMGVFLGFVEVMISGILSAYATGKYFVHYETIEQIFIALWMLCIVVLFLIAIASLYIKKAYNAWKSSVAVVV